jgi:hypothetical protein
LLGQGAFAGGSLPSAGCDVITNPVVSYAIGVFAFGVAFPHGAAELVAVVGAGVLISIGAVGLAHSARAIRHRPPRIRLNPNGLRWMPYPLFHALPT